MKRTGIINLIALFCFLISGAQEDFTRSLKGVKTVNIETGTRVKILAGDSNELKVTRYVFDSIDDEDHEHENCDHEHHANQHHDEHKTGRAKGLKPIYAGGYDNTGFGISIEQDGDILRIRDLKSWMQRKGLQIYLPKDININLDCGNMGKAIIVGFTSEIEVKTNIGGIFIKEVTGPVTAHTSTGLIDVDFTDVSQSSPISLNSSTGVVDVSLPANTKADLELRSTMGNVYTDFDLEFPKKDGMKPVAGNRKINAKLNNGGVKIRLSSSTGNVYLRKQ